MSSFQELEAAKVAKICETRDFIFSGDGFLHITKIVPSQKMLNPNNSVLFQPNPNHETPIIIKL